MLIIFIFLIIHIFSKNAHIEVKGTWKQPSFLVQASEFLSDVSYFSFWEIFSQKFDFSNDEEEFAFLKKLVRPEDQKLLELSLSINYYSPSIATFQQLGEQVLYRVFGEKFYEKKVETFVRCDFTEEVFFQKSSELEGVLNKVPSFDKSIEIFEFDHLYEKDIPDESVPTCVLYGNLDHLNSEKFSKILLEFNRLLTEAGAKVNYLFRHYNSKFVFDEINEERKDHMTSKSYEQLINLQGYGIELQIKDLEYRTTDLKARPKQQAPSEFEGVKFEQLIKQNPDQEYQLNFFRNVLIKKNNEISGMKVWEMQNLGIQSTSLIMGSENPLFQLRNISQNFPSYMKDLSRSSFKEEIKDEVKKNQKLIEEGRSQVNFGGKKLNFDRISIFTLYDMIKDEQSFYNNLRHLNLTREEESELKKISSVDLTEKIRFDFFDVEKDVVWLNDVENDRRYAQFPQDIKVVLRRGYGGRKPFPRKNLFNLIFAIDPVTEVGIETIASVMEVLRYGVPVRMGFVFLPHTGGSEVVDNLVDVNLEGGMTRDDPKMSMFFKVLSVFNYIKDTTSMEKAFQFLGYFRDEIKENAAITDEMLQKELRNHHRGLDYNEIVKIGYKTVNFAVMKKYKSGKLPKFNFALFNGKLFDMQENDLKAFIQVHLNVEHSFVANLVRKKVLLSEHENLLEKIVQHGSGGYTSYNEQIFRLNDYMMLPGASPIWPPKFFEMEGEGEKGQEVLKKFSYVFCVDLSEKKNIKIVERAMRFVSENQFSRMAVFHHSNKMNENAKSVMSSLLEAENIENILKILSGEKKFPVGTVKKNVDEIFKEQAKWCRNFDRNPFFLLNGKIVRDVDEFFPSNDSEDEEMLEVLENSLENVVMKIQESITESSLSSDLLLHLSSIILSSVDFSSASMYEGGQGGKIMVDSFVEQLDGDHTCIKVNEGANGPTVNAIIDPLSKNGQKMAEFVFVLADFFKFPTTVFLNPRTADSSIPLQSWYRYVFKPRLQFLPDGALKRTNFAFFENLPHNFILTLYTDEPDTWLLESTYAELDMDNINLDHVDPEDSLYARYQLENIVLVGSCVDKTQNNAPRGLQFLLKTKLGGKYDDTLVMANLGYFQLKANPGVYDLELAPGRHQEIFTFDQTSKTSFYYQNVKSFRREEREDKTSIFVNHFDGPFLYANMKRKYGMEKEELMVEEDKGSIWDRVKKGVFGDKKGGGKEGDLETINIFSVASGHLYERLLKIMIKSVTTTTKKSNVKFWIIKNYLSPQFKEFLPFMAEKYNFEYEFVIYKWPHWLFKQTDKIRIIWSFKILFLDVLFPLDVSKIIYVDSDQATRADLTELWNIDMQGKALAYTPFCNDKPEMDGYAFWKRGYWKNHLGDKKYIISALYIIDLDKFRKKYTGDQYRVIYDNLAKDENSLRNLDQDLPNFAQHIVPLHYLPKEWLWCETWCSAESKKKANTIDLCNNPQTKEHKVDQAKRIINEDNDWIYNWSDYNEEITKFTKEFEEKHGIVTK